jgi:hypothetical protein
MKDVGKLYDHLVYCTAILYFLWTFGIFWGHFDKFFQFCMSYQEKSGNLGHELSAKKSESGEKRKKKWFFSLQEKFHLCYCCWFAQAPRTLASKPFIWHPRFSFITASEKITIIGLVLDIYVHTKTHKYY